MIGQTLRTLLVLGGLLAALAAAGLAQPPHLPGLLTEFSR